MSENDSWTGQWFKAQQQFVDAWSEMAKSGGSGSASQADLWSRGFEQWRKACGGQAQPEIELALQKCMDMGREYLSMAEQISKGLAAGAAPVDAVNQWLEQMKQALQQFAGLPGFDGAGVNDFMKQWFAPNASWQEMVAGLMPMNQAAWQMPGMNTSVFNLGEMVDPLGKILEAPGIGYFREPQEKQQRGIQLALDYQQANFSFNQAFLRVALESIQGFQQRLLELGNDDMPRSLRGLYDLWVEVSEQHYSEFALSEEYQTLYGDMVNKLMIMRRHYGEIADDFLRALNLPNTREIDTMQERLQQLRRDNFALKRELREIKAALGLSGGAGPAARAAARKPARPKPVAAQRDADAPAATAAARKPAAKKAAKKTTSRPAANKAAANKAAAKKPAAKKPAANKAAGGKAATSRSRAGA